MKEYSIWLERLLTSPHILQSQLSQVPKEQGAYVLWLNKLSPECLKVGIAGPRSGKGLRERLKLHFASSTSDSVLAKHLENDSASTWSHGYNFTEREQRRKFLADKCYFQFITLPTLSREELLQFENFLHKQLKPIYAGRVVKRK